MPRSAFAPRHLRSGPFSLEDARAAGLTKWHLQFGPWQRVGPRTYAWSGLRVEPELLIEAASLRLPAGAAFSGLTAAWLHGLDVEPCHPIEVTIPKGMGVSGKAAIRVSRAKLLDGDAELVRGHVATSVPRTLRDLARRLPLTEAVVLLDAGLYNGLLELGELNAWIVHREDRHLAPLRRAVGYARPAAESPMETRLRMLLVLAGIPPPECQVPIYDRTGQFLGRLDLYYPGQRLGIEYDGATHRDSLPADDRRQNRLLLAGIRLLRFTAADVYNTPDRVVGEVSRLLRSAA